jgi:hypothetical protein
MNTKYISKFFLNTLISSAFLLCLLGISATQTNAQTFVEGNPNCAAYGLVETKIEPFDTSQVDGKTFILNNTVNGTVKITVTNSKEGNEATEFSFESFNKLIKKTIVKGQGSNVYSYDPAGTNNGQGLKAPGNNKGISHVSLCYEVTVGTTAATAMLAGRVQVESVKFRGLALVTILNINTLETQTVYTNRLGYYEFTDLTVGDTYVVTVRSKGYSFAPQTFTLIEDNALDMQGYTAARSLR